MFYLAEVSGRDVNIGRDLLQLRQGVHDDHIYLGPFHHLCVDSEVFFLD